MKILDISFPEQRIISFAGVSNFRDIGGYTAANNSSVRWELVYRSAHLSGLNDNDIDKLQDLGVRQSIDLRGAKESQRKAYSYDFIERQACAIEPDVARLVNEAILKDGAITVSDAHRFMHTMYRSFSTTYVDRFADFFKYLIQASEPVVVHCTAGKDRTGFACAMLLSTLGVHQDDILQDYLLTKQCYDVKLQARPGVDLAVMEVLWGVSAEYLETALTDIKREFGSVSLFLQRALGIDASRVDVLRDRLLI